LRPTRHEDLLKDVARRPLSILLTATTWWPLSARLAIRLLEHGCTVTALCPRGHVLHQVTGMGTIHSYAGFDSMAALDAVVAAARPDLVIPCDDRAVWQLHALHGSHPQHRELLERSLGVPEHYNTLRSRVDGAHMARDLGVPVPPTRSITSVADIHEWFDVTPGRAALKVDGSSGGHGVQIVDDPRECIAAWQRLAKAAPVGLTWKRWLVDSDPLAFWAPLRKGELSASLQKFIPGRPANAMVACWEGEVLGTVAVEVLCSQGATGASTIVRLIRNAQIEDAAARLVRGLRLSGFCGLDFILHEGAGVAYLIEVNPRCTQLGHLALPGQGDLAGLLCAHLGAPVSGDAKNPVAGELIAFFPQALVWSADSPYLQSSSHDIPWSEPKLVQELLRESWPDRRWLSRVYHFLRPRRAAPTRKLEQSVIDLYLSKIL
jgi:ATP-grasp domain